MEQPAFERLLDGVWLIGSLVWFGCCGWFI
jgi:hypothetical protein